MESIIVSKPAKRRNRTESQCSSIADFEHIVNETLPEQYLDDNHPIGSPVPQIESDPVDWQDVVVVVRKDADSETVARRLDRITLEDPFLDHVAAFEYLDYILQDPSLTPKRSRISWKDQVRKPPDAVSAPPRSTPSGRPRPPPGQRSGLQYPQR